MTFWQWLGVWISLVGLLVVALLPIFAMAGVASNDEKHPRGGGGMIE